MTVPNSHVVNGKRAKGEIVSNFRHCKSSKLAAMDDGGRLVKMEVDYSNTVDKTLPECQEIAKVSS